MNKDNPIKLYYINQALNTGLINVILGNRQLVQTSSNSYLHETSKFIYFCIIILTRTIQKVMSPATAVFVIFL
jgi:hypothetical protein